MEKLFFLPESALLDKTLSATSLRILAFLFRESAPYATCDHHLWYVCREFLKSLVEDLPPDETEDEVEISLNWLEKNDYIRTFTNESSGWFAIEPNPKYWDFIDETFEDMRQIRCLHRMVEHQAKEG